MATASTRARRACASDSTATSARSPTVPSRNEGMIAGFWIWQCDSLADAIDWLKKAPIRWRNRTRNSPDLRRGRLRRGLHAELQAAGRAPPRPALLTADRARLRTWKRGVRDRVQPTLQQNWNPIRGARLVPAGRVQPDPDLRPGRRDPAALAEVRWAVGRDPRPGRSRRLRSLLRAGLMAIPAASATSPPLRSPKMPGFRPVSSRWRSRRTGTRSSRTSATSRSSATRSTRCRPGVAPGIWLYSA